MCDPLLLLVSTTRVSGGLRKSGKERGERSAVASCLPPGPAARRWRSRNLLASESTLSPKGCYSRVVNGDLKHVLFVQKNSCFSQELFFSDIYSSQCIFMKFLLIFS